MKTKIKISTEDLILSLVRDKISLEKLNNEKDKIIYNLTKKLNKYEGTVENAR